MEQPTPDMQDADLGASELLADAPEQAVSCVAKGGAKLRARRSPKLAPAPVAATPPKKRGRKPSIPDDVPPLDPNGPPVTVYERLQAYGLLRKLTDISIARAAVPWGLRADAAQEIHLYWCTLFVKPEFKRNQLACYAYRSGHHAALSLRRQLGATVVLPGSIFRQEKRNSAFLESIGAAVNPWDVDNFADSLELAEDGRKQKEYRVSQKFFRAKIAWLGLPLEQERAAHLVLVEGMAAHDAAEAMGCSVDEIDELLAQVTKRLEGAENEDPDLLTDKEIEALIDEPHVAQQATEEAVSAPEKDAPAKRAEPVKTQPAPVVPVVPERPVAEPPFVSAERVVPPAGIATGVMPLPTADEGGPIDSDSIGYSTNEASDRFPRSDRNLRDLTRKFYQLELGLDFDGCPKVEQPPACGRASLPKKHRRGRGAGHTAPARESQGAR